jgi:hypothetical protein
MATFTATITHEGLVREVRWNSVTKEAERESESAGTWVSLGHRSSLESAKETAIKDMKLGPRKKGDKSAKF